MMIDQTSVVEYPGLNLYKIRIDSIFGVMKKLKSVLVLWGIRNLGLSSGFISYFMKKGPERK
jgi:hypothetical protein